MGRGKKRSSIGHALDYSHSMQAMHAHLNEIPTYGLPEASAFLRLPYAVVREWTRDSTLVRVDVRNLLSYSNLLELHILKGLRRTHGLSMQRVRRGLATYKELYRSAHPLLDFRLQTDGFSLILHEEEKYVNLSRSG